MPAGVFDWTQIGYWTFYMEGPPIGTNTILIDNADKLSISASFRFAPAFISNSAISIEPSYAA